MTVTVRSARAGQAALVLRFVRELAEYERALDEVEADEAAIDAMLFSANPRAFCDIAEIDGSPIGFALWFYNASTWKGRHGLYLEDLYVTPEARGKGAGKALLANLAQRCVAENLGRLEWAVLDWNAPSIAFYDSLGAASMDEWIIRRLTGAPLKALSALATKA